jgi:hypothetical protein
MVIAIGWIVILIENILLALFVKIKAFHHFLAG